MRGIEQFLQVDAATLGALKYAGTWNASTNTPTLASGVGVQGQYYVVSVAGSTNLDGETAWQVGDWAVFNGSVWQKVDGGSTGLLTTLTVTGNTFLATTSGDVAIGSTTTTGRMSIDTGDGVVCFRNYNSVIGAGTGSALDFLDASRSSVVDGGIRATNLTLVGFGATPILFSTNNTERMRITSAGDVGIGTSSPSYKLDIRGSAVGSNFAAISVDNTAAGSGSPANTVSINFSNGGAVKDSITGAVYGDGYLAFATNNNTEKMRIDSSGNVGVGTTSPTNKLHIVGSGDILRFTNGTVSLYGYSDSAGLGWFTGTGGTNVGVYYNNTSSHQSFYTSSTERMRIDSSGNVGINTSSPLSKLTVSAANTASGSEQLNITDTTTNNRLRLGYNTATNLGVIEALTAGVAYRDIVINPNGGNLGLGVTPSAWSSYKALQVNTGATLASTVNQMVLGSNWSFDGSDRYITSDYSTIYIQNSGQHKWYTAPSGTAGNAISFTQAMTLDASGNLLVGATSNPGVLNTSVVINSGANSLAGLVLQNNATGSSSTDGSHITIVGTELRIVNSENAPTLFLTNNAERARITSSGDFHVARTTTADTTVGISLFNSGTITCARSSSSDADLNLYVYSTGAAAARFYVGMGGTVYATNTTISAISDQRFKENIRDLDVGLNAIMALKPRKFDWKTGKGKDIKDDRGFIAQEFEQVFPDLVDDWADPAPKGEDPYKSVRQDLIPVLVKAIQELKAEVDSLKTQLGA